jgi:ABC-type amino acid transport substrate-binding protein
MVYMRSFYRFLPFAVLAFLINPHSLLAEPATSHLQRIRDSGKLVLRCFPDQQNLFLRIDTSRGAMPETAQVTHFEGIDVEILSRIAELLGVELEIRPIPEPSLTQLLDAVATGDGDLAGGGLTVTAQRQERFTLSQPYHWSSDLILVHPEAKVTAETLWQGRAALLRGSSFDDALAAAGYPKGRAQYVEFTIDTLGLVLEGGADFTFVDSVSLPENLPDRFRVAYRFGEPNPLVYLLPKGSDLKEELDRALEAMGTSGELAKILDRYSHAVVDLESVPKIDPANWCPDGCTPR